MLDGIAVLGAFLAGLFFFSKRALRYLRFFQQEQYNHKRFISWYKERLAFDRMGSPIAVVAGVLCFVFAGSKLLCLVVSLLAGAILCAGITLEEDPRKTGKLRLNMTQRATRIYHISFVIFGAAALLGALCALKCSTSPGAWAWLWQIVLFQATPFLVPLADLALKPAEKRVQEGFIAEAKARLAKTGPYVIGITGSYGKTSTKAMLGELLNNCLGPTFWPEKGVNSAMGITREIREKMRPYHRYAVIEMGMFQRGSIKKLCDLVPPRAGIVTAVGAMHLERAGSLENIQLGKAELAQALPEDGILVCNGDNEGARSIASDHRKKTTILYGLREEAGGLDCWASDLKVGADGTSFSLHWQGKTWKARVPQLGEPAVSNALAAFSMACALGADPEYAIACMGSLEPVENRLQLQRANGVLRLRDAYNSNPVGFASALKVLSQLEAKRRVLVTPGMIELGSRQYDENFSVASQAAAVCDQVLLVGDTNRQAFEEGLRKGGFAPEKLKTFDRMVDALAHFESEAAEGDVLLIENDLPDLYEGTVRF